MDDYDHAGSLLQKAMTLDQPPVAIYKFLGKVYLHQKHYPDAIKAFHQYLAVETHDSSGYILLARCYKSTGDTRRMNEAIATYKKISAEAKGNGEAQQALDEAGNGEKAEDDEGQ
jgi:predicted Zn-dependent protease